jgi:penicillin-binding protein A
MRPWLISVAALGLALTLIPMARRGAQARAALARTPTISLTSSPARGAGVQPAAPQGEARTGDSANPPPVDGLDLSRIGLADDGATAPVANGGVARLTIDPELEARVWSILSAYRLPEAAIVALDPETGAIKAYASRVEHGPKRDLILEASAPAASIFKIVTASALVETASLSADTRQCYSGGEQKILSSDLVDDALRDRWCVTLAGAMGRSINAVFARLAARYLKPEQLEEKAHSFGFGETTPFDVPVATSRLKIPLDTLGFARTAAGFWNTTLSPLHAAWLSAAIARGGESIRPTIVSAVRMPGAAEVERPKGTTSRRVVAPETAEALTTMLEHTVTEGTSFHAFHDAHGTPFLPNVSVAGKTGTLTDDHSHRFYTWFTGFAPSRPVPGAQRIVVAVLVVNGPAWRVKANVLAREVFQAYFAGQRVSGVSYPKVDMIAASEP